MVTHYKTFTLCGCPEYVGKGWGGGNEHHQPRSIGATDHDLHHEARCRHNRDHHPSPPFLRPGEPPPPTHIHHPRYVKSELYEKAIHFFERASQIQPNEVRPG